VNHRKDLFSSQLWDTVGRILRERFFYLDRVPQSEFLHNLKQIEARPWNLHIELTNICNANCIFCAYHLQSRKKTIMEKEIYSKALNDYCVMGGGELRLETCLGEPLIDPNFVERVRQARAHPEITRITTLTNGINLDRIGIEEILRSGLNEIGISSGPWDEGLYKLIYRNEDYIRMRNNVIKLLEKKLEIDNPVEIKILFRSSLSMKKTLNLADYKMIKQLPHKVEFNTDFDTWLGNIKQKDLIPDMHLRPLSRLEKEPCYWLYDGPIIFADGKVGLCGCRDFNADSELIIGNISEDFLLDLWHSEKVSRLRQRFWDGDFPGICTSCSAYANLDYYRSKRGSLRAGLVNKWLGAKGR
jgi:pyruvate-formate lyase-activating enzyme